MKRYIYGIKVAYFLPVIIFLFAFSIIMLIITLGNFDWDNIVLRYSKKKEAIYNILNIILWIDITAFIITKI